FPFSRNLPGQGRAPVEICSGFAFIASLNPKSEYRNPKEDQVFEFKKRASSACSSFCLSTFLNWTLRPPFVFRFLSFGFASDFAFRVWDLNKLLRNSRKRYKRQVQWQGYLASTWAAPISKRRTPTVRLAPRHSRFGSSRKSWRQR